LEVQNLTETTFTVTVDKNITNKGSVKCGNS